MFFSQCPLMRGLIFKFVSLWDMDGLFHYRPCPHVGLECSALNSTGLGSILPYNWLIGADIILSFDVAFA